MPSIPIGGVRGYATLLYHLTAINQSFVDSMLIVHWL
jgi:hypothetical protein